MNVRLATESDAARVFEIYTPIVNETSISFELVPPALDTIRDRIRTVLGTHAWLVAEQDGAVLGYAYATAFRAREAYQWTTEVTVYVHRDHRGRGVARALYPALFRVLALQGYRTAVAVIALPNAGSVRLHEALGFHPIGVFHSIGHKFGEWHDTGWWQLQLGAYDEHPHPPRSLAALTGSPLLAAALQAPADNSTRQVRTR